MLLLPAALKGSRGVMILPNDAKTSKVQNNQSEARNSVLNTGYVDVTSYHEDKDMLPIVLTDLSLANSLCLGRVYGGERVHMTHQAGKKNLFSGIRR